MKNIFYILIVVFWLTSCTAKVSDPTTKSSESAAESQVLACSKGQCPCVTPVGSIASGSQVTVYTQATAACNENCGQYAQVLTCNNGTLSADTSGLFFTCTAEPCPQCLVGANLIPSGESVTFYNMQTIDCSDSCANHQQVRTCNMGTLSGDSSFQYTSCSRGICHCPLPDGSGFISVGGQATFYSTQATACGAPSCAQSSLVRTCQEIYNPSGPDTFAFSGSSSFAYTSCQGPTGCTCTLPTGGILNTGQTAVLSTVPSVACGQSCSSQPSLTVLCTNGTLYDPSGNPIPQNSSGQITSTHTSQYQYVCVAKTCADCLMPDGSTYVASGTTEFFYPSATIGCTAGLTCQGQNYTCTNGSWYDPTNTLTAITGFSTTCSRRACQCAYDGNSVAVGSSAPFYSTGQAACGQNCATLSKSLLCQEVASGNTYTDSFQSDPVYTFSSCLPPSGCSCALPGLGGLTGSILNGKTVVLTSSNPVPCGQICSQVPSVTLTCTNGVFVGTDGTPVDTSSSSYPYQYFCTTGNCNACQLPGWGSIGNNTTMTLYSKSTFGCADQIALSTYVFNCQNGELLRNGNPYDPAQDPNAPATYYSSYTSTCTGCPLPWGGTVNTSSCTTGYKYSGTVINGCGRGCKSTQLCCDANGNLTGDTTYNMPSCSNSCNQEGGGAPPRMCLLRWSNSYATPDSQIPMFNQRIVDCSKGDTCFNHFKLSRCQMATGTFDATFDYMYPVCTEICN